MFRRSQNDKINQLIERMLSPAEADPKTSDSSESKQTVSWYAHREAEKLVDVGLIPTLIELIAKEPNKKARDVAYFILGKICFNARDGSAAQFMIDRAEFETDRYIKSAIYDLLADIPKPAGTNLSSVVAAAKDKNWLIRHSAICALGNCEDDEIEEILIAISDQAEDPFDVVYANSTLNKHGSTRAIPTLEKHLKSRMRDVKISAQLAIDEIRKRQNPIPE